MGLAATIGREFTFTVLAGASAEEEGTVFRGLDELWRRRIVRDHGADGYDFTHELIRDVAYETLSAARRCMLHRQVAQALEAAHVPCVEVAAHYEKAGMPEQAVRFYFRAGEAARSIYANDEAMRHYRQALALLPAATLPERDEEWNKQVLAPLYEGVGDVLSLTGRHLEARSAYGRALEHVNTEDALWQARLYRNIGNAFRDQHQYEEARQAYLDGDAALGRAATPFDSDWWREWVQLQLERIWNAYWPGDLPVLAELVQEARAAVERYGTTVQRAVFYHSLVLWANRRDRFVISDQTLDDARAALAASRVSGNLHEIAITQFALGFCHLWHMDLGDAHSNLESALETCQRIGVQAYRIRCLAYLSVVHRMRCEAEGMQELASRCLEAATVPEALEYVGVAKANLAWLAWRDGAAEEAQENGRDALDCFDRSRTGFPFRWLALWPLLALATSQASIDGALCYAQSMLDVSQQALPLPLATLLEDAIRAGELGQPAAARSYLRRAIELAQEMSYL